MRRSWNACSGACSRGSTSAAATPPRESRGCISSIACWPNSSTTDRASDLKSGAPDSHQLRSGATAMALNVRAFLRNLVDLKGDLPRLATGGAWLFAIGSLFPLLWLINDGAADGHVFGTTLAGHTYTIPLLTYSGGIGMLLIWAEILAIAGAFILAAAPRVPLKL